MQSFPYRIDRGVAIIEVKGDQTFGNTADVHIRLAADPAFRFAMPKIIDTRHQTSFMGPGDIVRFRDLLAKQYGGSKTRRRVAVVSTDEFVEKIVKLYREIFSMSDFDGLIEYRVFTSMEDAEAWARE